jgi:hypothetical protein
MSLSSPQPMGPPTTSSRLAADNWCRGMIPLLSWNRYYPIPTSTAPLPRSMLLCLHPLIIPIPVFPLCEQYHWMGSLVSVSPTPSDCLGASLRSCSPILRNSQYSQFRMLPTSTPKVSTLVHSNAQPSHLLVTFAVTQNVLRPVIQISQQPTSYPASLSA